MGFRIIGKMPHLPDIILQPIIRYQNAYACHILDKGRYLCDVGILNIPMRHFRVLCNTDEMLSVYVNQ